jgi:hypothetical protein
MASKHDISSVDEQGEDIDKPVTINQKDPLATGSGGEFLDEDGDGDAELQADAADFKGKPAKNVGPLTPEQIHNAPQVGARDTIQAAVEDTDAGEAIVVTADYDPAAETLPITIGHPVDLVGPGIGHTSGELNFSGNSTDSVFQFNIETVGNNEETPSVRGLRIVGGANAYELNNTIAAIFERCELVEQSGDAVVFGNSNQANHSNVFRDVRIRRAGGGGFVARDNAKAHATELRGCQVTACAGDPVDVSSTAGGRQFKLIGGVYEKNDGYVDIRDGEAVVRGVYFEGNDSGNTLDLNLTATGTVAGCRFNGNGNNSWAVNLNGGERTSVRECQFFSYTDGFVNISSNATEPRIETSSIYDKDGIGVIRQDNGVRTVLDGWGENAGDPSAGSGDWAGNGYEGASVVDTTNNTKYVYRGGAWV